MHSYDKNINNIMISMIHDFAILSNWLDKNIMVFNPDKCSFILIGIKDELETIVADWCSMGRVKHAVNFFKDSTELLIFPKASKAQPSD